MEFPDYSLPEKDLSDPQLSQETYKDDDAMDIDDAALRKDIGAGEDNLTLTTNSAVAFKSTESACLDFFYKVQETALFGDVKELLDAAWAEDANITLRLIFQLRDIRKGKGVRRPFLYCLKWLMDNHYRTLMYNLKYVADVGCWKDLLDLLVMEAMGVEKHHSWITSEANRARHVKPLAIRKRDKSAARPTAKAKKEIFETSIKIDKEQAASDARQLFLTKEEYCCLHIHVANLFADALRKDLASMKDQKPVSLASKWAPTACKHHDNLTLIVSTISQILFPQSEFRREDQSYEAYVSAVRNLYRKTYLTPLRKYSKVIERFMSDKHWADIPYDRVPSKSMKRNKKTFIARDGDRFNKYLGDVESGKKTIKSSALNPHEMVEQVLGKNELEEAELKTVELQWNAYVKKLLESGTLSNCMAVCDVSGSMSGKPMCVAISLSLLVADLAEEPFKGLICTFSSSPELFKVPDGSLDAKVNAVAGMNWEMSTNVEAVFDLILERATSHSILQEAMIKRLFIFSDMQFNEASSTGKTNFETVKEKFNSAGYDLPQLVFWNLASYLNNPVVKHEQDTALVSGFSGQLLKVFMEDKLDRFDPISILMRAVESYTFLKVID